MDLAAARPLHAVLCAVVMLMARPIADRPQRATDLRARALSRLLWLVDADQITVPTAARPAKLLHNPRVPVQDTVRAYRCRMNCVLLVLPCWRSLSPRLPRKRTQNGVPERPAAGCSDVD